MLVTTASFHLLHGSGIWHREARSYAPRSLRTGPHVS